MKLRLLCLQDPGPRGSTWNNFYLQPNSQEKRDLEINAETWGEDAEPGPAPPDSRKPS